MAVMPGARWRDVGAPRRYSNGLMRSYLGAVLHVNDSQGDQVTSINGDSLFAWITEIGPGAMSCHFQVSQTGGIEQYIDTRYSSWCQGAGNNDYLSIETEGLVTDPLTPAQVSAVGRIMAFLHVQHGIPLQVADHPGERGIGWHGMGAPTWGHPACPGDPRKAQRRQILDVAAGLLAPVPPPANLRKDVRMLIAYEVESNMRYLVFGPQSYVILQDGATVQAHRDAGIPLVKYTHRDLSTLLGRAE